MTRTQGFVNLVNIEQGLLDVHPTAFMLLQSLIFLLQLPKLAPARLPAPSFRGWPCYRTGLTVTGPPYTHRWPGHPSSHPHLLLFFRRRQPHPATDQPALVLPSAWASTIVASPAPGRSLPWPRRHPPHWCSRYNVVNMVNK